MFVLCVAAVVVGGIDMMSQSLVLAKKPHIVIGKNLSKTTVSAFDLHDTRFILSCIFSEFF